MDLLSISNDDRLAALAKALVLRERELLGYKLNIDNYMLMLSGLPQDEWPQELAAYKNADANTLSQVDARTAAVISDYNYRDRLRCLVVTESIEMRKSQRVYDAVRSQLPQDQIAALVEAAKNSLDQAVPAPK